MSNGAKANTSKPATKPLGKLVFGLGYVLVYPALLLFLSGDWLWVEGWIFSVWFVALCFTAIIYLYLRDPALLAERYKLPGTGSQKGWDRYIVYGIVIGFMAWFVVMPLDAKRYGWTGHFPLWFKVLGGVALLPSFFLFFRSYTDNTFLSPLVRIQEDRKQQVVTTGVYGFVRHPMYLGASFLFVGAPMLLGSLWGIGLGVAGSLLLAVRIIGEEKMLTDELEGYADYKKKVRYRLIPFVW
jgi:protein-S-isoprenylcysteine O-methyltransferase Ste14